MAKVTRNPLELTKSELRGLENIKDPVAREVARQAFLNSRIQSAAERAEAKSNRGKYAAKVSDTGYLIVNGNGTFRPLVFTYEGFNAFMANIEATKALHATMPKVPSPVVKK